MGWLPQRRVGWPTLDVYIVDTAIADGFHRYISNEEYHCNQNVCTQLWAVEELETFRKVNFGLSQVSVPIGAETYLGRVYGDDWKSIVKPHRWASETYGDGFEPYDVKTLAKRAAG